MPIIQSAIKRARQNVTRRERRQPVKSLMKTMIRKISDLAKEQKMTEAQALLPVAFKSIDMAAKKHLIHPSNAARKKSSLTRLLTAK